MGPVSSIRTPFGGSFLRYRNHPLLLPASGASDSILTLIEDKPNLLLSLDAKWLEMNIVATSQSPRVRCKCD